MTLRKRTVSYVKGNLVMLNGVVSVRSTSGNGTC